MNTPIKLVRGEEVVINGYIIRAVGLNPQRPDQLQIRQRRWPMLWGGCCDDVVTATSIVIGTKPETLPPTVRRHPAYGKPELLQWTPEYVSKLMMSQEDDYLAYETIANAHNTVVNRGNPHDL
jgi:hypothetical protein